MGDGKPKIGPLSHFKGWVKRQKKNSKKLPELNIVRKKIVAERKSRKRCKISVATTNSGLTMFLPTTFLPLRYLKYYNVFRSFTFLMARNICANNYKDTANNSVILNNKEK